MSNENETVNPGIEVADGAAEAFDLTPETFSFLDVLEGITYPKDTVNIYLNEGALFKRAKLLLRIGEADEEADISDLIEEIKGVEADIEASRYVFHISGVSDDHVADAKDVVDAHFESKFKQVKAADGTMRKRLPESESEAYTRYFTALVLSLHIEQVVAPNGSVLTAPGVDEIAYFMDKAPTMEKSKLNERIGDLRVSSSEYEASIDDDFLAKP